ncbi:neuronal acetylcholine receptor subunit alpha-10-like [Lineus longissimus]|uniref:neuronal acetylcholine receptor subunit alpha-10-like n=1 Tax=Lineus longissimus TaxID=88925 RepID=UPI00315DC519
MNNAAGKVLMAEETGSKIQIWSKGVVAWPVQRIITTTCVLDMSNFPFDKQTCKVVMSSPSYTIDQLIFSNLNEKASLSFYQENSEWELLDSIQEVHIIADSDRESMDYDVMEYSVFTLKLILQRRTGYYWVHILIPCMCISLLVALAFYMPIDSGERVSFTVTILLAFTVYQLLIADSLPRTSETTSRLSVYLTVLVCLSSLAVFLTMLVLNVHHQDPDKPLPKWFRWLTFRGLAFLTLKRQSARKLEAEFFPSHSMVTPDPSTLYPKDCRSVGAERSAISLVQIGGMEIQNNKGFTSMREPDFDGLLQPPSGQFGPCWRLAAVILDRSFMTLYIIVTVISTIIILSTTWPNDFSNETKTGKE